MIQVMNYKNKGLPWAVEDCLDKLVEEVNRLDTALAAAQRQIMQMPKPLTLTQISKGLSAQGAAPLNLTGLAGK